MLFQIFPLVSQGEDTQFASIDDSGDVYQVEKYSKGLSFTEEVFINDSTDEIMAVLRNFPLAAAKKEMKVFYDQLLNGLSEGGAIFQAGRNNLTTELAGLNIDSLAELEAKLAEQAPLGNDDDHVEYPAAYLLVNSRKKRTAMQIINGTTIANETSKS